MPSLSEIVNKVLAQNARGSLSSEQLPAERTLVEIGLTSLGLMKALLMLDSQLDTRCLTPERVRALRTVGDVHVLFAAQESSRAEPGE